MKIVLLGLLMIEVACATSLAPLDFPAVPTFEQLLEESGFARADEDTLVKYAYSHWDAAGSWLPDVTGREEEQMMADYFGEKLGKVGTKETLPELFRRHQMARLHDPRRIVDAVIREIGRRGTEKSIDLLVGLAEREEREWVAWKALASVVDILARVDPAKIDGRTMTLLSAKTIAPLLRDLDPEQADAWAWTLWERQNHSLGSSTFRSLVPLVSRLWLAKAFASSHPKEAAVVFEEGLQSQDAAIRTMAGMIVRSGTGSSIGFEKSAVGMMEAFKAGEWKSGIPMWQILPLPLDRPLIQRTRGGRRDLVWLDDHAAVAKTIQDVWPLIREQVGDGMYYSQIGETRNRGLSDAEGRIFSRFRNLLSEPVLASHGGLCGIEGRFGLAVELQADGSSLWECPVRNEFLIWVPGSRGRVVLLSRTSLECRDRRGDLVWKTSLKGFDDPRFLVAIDDNHFVVSCGKSIGWLTKDGEYRPILKGLKSAGWIRYHPTEPWIVLEGNSMTAIVFDPKAGKEMGRFDTDDGHGNGESRFPFPRTYFPE